MAVVRFAKLIFSAAGSLEPFCSGSIGLDLGHCLFLLLPFDVKRMFLVCVIGRRCTAIQLPPSSIAKKHYLDVYLFRPEHPHHNSMQSIIITEQNRWRECL
jgi:hypothetical protein